MLSPNSLIPKSQILKFIETGKQESGILSLLRELLYANWLSEGHAENHHGVDMFLTIENISNWAFDPGKARDKPSGKVKREIRDFLRYLVGANYSRDAGNSEFDDEKIVAQMYKSAEIGPENPHGSIRVGSADVDAAAFFAVGSENRLTIEHIRMVKNFVEFYLNSPRGDVIDHIAEILIMEWDSARKIYNRGLVLIDYLLLTAHTYRSEGQIIEDLHASSIPAHYEWIKQILRK